MNLTDNMRITHHVLVATINEGLTRKFIRLGTENKNQIGLCPEASDPSSKASCEFTFTHVETEVYASISHDKMGGVHIVASLFGNNSNTESACLGVVIGQLYPARPNSDPAVLVLEQAGLCGDELVPERIFAMNHEHPTGYSLVMQ